ncbi:MAG: penicillin-binding protein 2 [Saprospiraceae bacterium]|nr:penicillin-binding protein 2 [Saprospiraceae bacterium]MDW8484321.1 penicillin-binding protein 2 [Saprospiraceae bacterium]
MVGKLRERQQVIQRVFIFSALVLLLKAAQLQLFDKSLSQRAEATTIHRQTIYPPRGLVFDRRDSLLVTNSPVYDLMVTYNQISPKMDTLKLCRLLGITRREFEAALRKDWKSGKFSRSVPFVFMKKIPTTTYARLQECLYEFPGFFVQVRNIRDYPYRAGAHVLGYINEVDQRDIERGGGVYASGDYIGATGIELQYETRLRGKKGFAFLLKDNLGRIVGKYADGNADTMAASGDDLILSIDARLQQYGEALMTNKTGSIVAIEPSTGEILAMISSPTYDPNDLVMTSDRGSVFRRLHSDPLKPLFDRTVMAKYPPGSIFKTVVSLIGMQEGTLNPNAGQACGGGYFYAGRLYKCHAHGAVTNVVDALAYSCNTYYFTEFRNIIDKYGFNNPHEGLNKFYQYCRELGLSRQLKVDYPNESAGNIPDARYYDRIYPKHLGGWRSPTIMSLGIGQGEIQMTTLQMANLAACIANRGYWYPPHLAKGFKKGGDIPAYYRQRQVVNIDPKYFELVVEGMAQCVNRGTARASAIPNIQVCGKTGTSQNPHGDDHSVFFAFAPKDNPKIAIAVYVENAGWGASYAAPIASLMIEKYLNDTIAAERKPLEERMLKANLTEKYLQNRRQAALKPRPRPTLPSIPSPDIPTDEPSNGQPGSSTLGQNERKRQ